MISHQVLKKFLLICILLLAGCSTLTELRLDMADKLFGREPPNPPAELKEITPTKSVKIDWSVQTGKTADYDYTPVVEAGAVYEGNAEGELAKWDVESGRELWRINTEETISGGVGAGGGLILVGTNRGHVMAYDFDGKLVWTSQLSSEILSAPKYFDGLVIARSGDNRIYGLDAIDGSRKWVYERKVPALSLRSSAGIVVDGGAVYAGFSGGKMAAIRSDNGKLLWEATVAIPKGVTEIERIADVTSLPVVAGPIVYAVAYQGRIAAIDRKNGKVLWNREISSYRGMSFDDGKIYLSHSLGSLYSLDNETGRTFWRQGELLNRRLTTPLNLKGMVVVGDLEGYLHFISIENGKFVARIKIDDEAVMSLTKGKSSSQVIAATRGGGLYAVSVKDFSVSKSIDLDDDQIQIKDSTASEVYEGEVAVSPDETEFEGGIENRVEEPTTSNENAPAVSPDETEFEDGRTSNQGRSILFEQDSSGPGIKLPRAQ